KTTLAAIFRSLQSGSPHWVLERQTLNRNDPPEISLLFAGGLVSFSNGAWSAPVPGIEVFDNTFVHENVYAGDCVQHDHKKNLYRVIVGEQGITLAAEVDALDAKVRDANKDIGEKKLALCRSISPGMDVEDFVA